MNAIVLDAADPSAIAQASDLLRQGRDIILPSETIYGIAVNLCSSEARARIKALKQLPANPGWVIHVGRPTDALAYVPNASALARRVINKSWPGPIALQFSLDPSQLAQIAEHLGAATPETVVDGHITLRCPDHYATQEILSRVSAPVALVSAAVAGGPSVLEASAVPPSIADQMDAILDGGPTRYNKTSTLVKVAGDKIEVLRRGVIDGRIIERLGDQLILFVCSGNTCRSPMAAGIAARLLADKLKIEPQDIVHRHLMVQSAGLHAVRGQHATPEAQEAVRDLNVDLRSHYSQPLSRDLLRRADVIYTMTDSHREEILEAMPGLQHKTHRLDPQGDIEDPIGGAIETYRQVANRLTEVLNKRLAELPV